MRFTNRSLLLVFNLTLVGILLGQQNSKSLLLTDATLDFTDCFECPTIISETVAEAPADRSRTTIGIGEEVIISLSSFDNPSEVNWEIVEGEGDIQLLLGDVVKFTAGELAGETSIRYYFADNSCEESILFTIVAPDLVYMNCPSEIEQRGCYHVQNYPVGGFRVTPFIFPDNVSFGRIEVQELDAVYHISEGSANFWHNTTYEDHPIGEWFGLILNNVIEEYGTEVDATDEVQMGVALNGLPNPPGSLDRSGGVYVDIPMNYKVIGTNNEYEMVNKVHTEIASIQNGDSEVWKSDFVLGFLASAPTLNGQDCGYCDED